ncbi:sulfatase-like hydrolase/transferase [Brevibacillus brevis]|uniref:sulfatase-like hydrolase/transferase n=1 Tax=Brevibacillus brevis TaxID=1393 RepID=UPI00115A9777|nr:sulfatase-like hydrolase/transferase [Lysinibacillus sp. SDF0063]TQR35032.1 arylsulfatase [Lysinibacillus sp. SDF0063]
MSRKWLRRRPNILFIIVDQERFPPVYEELAIREWREDTLHAHAFLREHGLEFKRHYVGSTACCPSRATLFTGQYPSLHGVTQTSGAAKRSADSDMFWLDRNTVPTMGNYFRQAGYRCFYKGKWHFSDADIWVPGTHVPTPSYTLGTGVPDPDKERLYLLADRLDGYGFSSWIGPEPHGIAPHNSGSSAAIGVNGRDVVYSSEVIELLHALDHEKGSAESYHPWLIVASFVNPHDIAIYGDISASSPFFRFHVDKSVPTVAPPPTQYESLATKPRCQASYQEVYPQAFQPISDQAHYRRLYYQLQKNADREVMRVLEALVASSFYPETLVVFTSDHGELLGAHGKLYQKWYCAYEEAIHIPLIIHNPLLFPLATSTELLTSHVDILPTLLGMAGADTDRLRDELTYTHSEVRPLVGRDLTPIILTHETDTIPSVPIYFMTDDDVTKGQHQVNVQHQPYDSVIPPNRIETVIACMNSAGHSALWKYSRYFAGDVYNPTMTDYELYNLTTDPLETRNMVIPLYKNTHSERVRLKMELLLEEQRAQKRLTPFSPPFAQLLST